MRGNPGYLYSVIGGGKAIAYHKEQQKEFADLKKVYVHLLTDEFEPVLDENGKERAVLKSVSLLKHIGFID